MRIIRVGVVAAVLASVAAGGLLTSTAAAAPSRAATYACVFDQTVGGYQDGAWPVTMGGGVETAVFHWCPSAVSPKGNLAFTADVQVDGAWYRHAFVSLKGKVTDLGALFNGGKVNSQARDVNDAGQVVGLVEVGGAGASRLNGFQWQPGVTAPTQFGGSWNVVPRAAVNGSGQIVYSALTSTGPSPVFELFVRTWAGDQTSVDQHSTGGGPYVIDVDINDAGLVVAASMEGGKWWQPGTIALQPLPLGTLTVGSPRAVNGAGSVVGTVQGVIDMTPQPARWSSVSEVPSVLPWRLDGYAVAAALNNRGIVVGHIEQPDTEGLLVAVAQNARGRVTTLPALAGDQMSLTTGVSDSGVVVGSSVAVTGGMMTTPSRVTFTTWRS